MEENEQVDWDRILSSENFVGGIETDKEKVLVLELPPMMREVDKFGSKKMELVLHCVEEDGEIVDKNFTTLSRRLMKKLKPILENAHDEDRKAVKVSMLRVGEAYETQYSVKEIKPKKGEELVKAEDL